jgi:hypothetical protein
MNAHNYNQGGILGAKLLEEISVNGPGTAKQLGEAIGLDFDRVIGKLIGMRRDGLLTTLSANRTYCVWGLADW